MSGWTGRMMVSVADMLREVELSAVQFIVEMPEI